MVRRHIIALVRLCCIGKAVFALGRLFLHWESCLRRKDVLAAINNIAGPFPCHSVSKGAAHSVMAGSISELCGYHCVAPLAPPDTWRNWASIRVIVSLLANHSRILG